jgi:uncharacterized protein (UPF0335 family)
MRLSSRYNPAGGIADFWNEIRRPTPYRFPVLIASLLCTGALLYLIMTESVLAEPERPKVSFISTFAQGRTDAEIIASNIANQRRQERLEAEQAKRDEDVKNAYKALGRATGLDVDAMERQAAAEKAAEAARMKALLERNAKADAVAPRAE